MKKFICLLATAVMLLTTLVGCNTTTTAPGDSTPTPDNNENPE